MTSRLADIAVFTCFPAPAACSRWHPHLTNVDHTSSNVAPTPHTCYIMSDISNHACHAHHNTSPSFIRK